MGFFVRNLGSSTPDVGTPLVFSYVRYNAGNGYDNSTGYFTAPVSGQYFFMATTSSYLNNASANFHIMVDNTTESYGYSNRINTNNYATTNAVLNVRQGQTVWVRSNGNRYLFGFETHFSGVLIKPDLQL